MRSLFVVLISVALLTACEEPAPPHLVTVCTEGHWAIVEKTGEARFGPYQYTENTFICTKEVTQCQADEAFVGPVVCK